MLYIIIGIIVIAILWEIIKKIGKGLIYVVGAVAGLGVLVGLIWLAVYLIRNFGGTILKIVLIIAAIAIALFAISAAVYLIRNRAATKRYIDWLNRVGIGPDSESPEDRDARDSAVSKGAARLISSDCAVSPHFYQQIKREVIEKGFIWQSELAKFSRSVAPSCSAENLPMLMDYLEKDRQSIILTPSGHESGMLSANLFSIMEDAFNAQGAVTDAEFQTTLNGIDALGFLRSEFSWLSPTFLKLLVERGTVSQTNMSSYGTLYTAKVRIGYNRMTSDELSLDD